MKHRVIDSPVGPLTLVVDDAGVLCALYTDGQKYVPDAVGLGERDDTIERDESRCGVAIFVGSVAAQPSCLAGLDAVLHAVGADREHPPGHREKLL